MPAYLVKEVGVCYAASPYGALIYARWHGRNICACSHCNSVMDIPDVELNFEDRPITKVKILEGWRKVGVDGKETFWPLITTSAPRYWDYKHKKLVDSPTQWCTDHYFASRHGCC